MLPFFLLLNFENTENYYSMRFLYRMGCPNKKWDASIFLFAQLLKKILFLIIFVFTKNISMTRTCSNAGTIQVFQNISVSSQNRSGMVTSKPNPPPQTLFLMCSYFTEPITPHRLLMLGKCSTETTRRNKDGDKNRRQCWTARGGWTQGATPRTLTVFISLKVTG